MRGVEARVHTYIGLQVRYELEREAEAATLKVASRIRKHHVDIERAAGTWVGLGLWVMGQG